MYFALFIVANVTNALNRSSVSFCEVEDGQKGIGRTEDEGTGHESWYLCQRYNMARYPHRILVACFGRISGRNSYWLTDWPTRNDCYPRQKNTRAFSSDWSGQRRADCSYFMRKWDYRRLFEQLSLGWQFEGSDFKGEFPWLFLFLFRVTGVANRIRSPEY